MKSKKRNNGLTRRDYGKHLLNTKVIEAFFEQKSKERHIERKG